MVKLKRSKMQKIMSRIADVNRLKKLGWEVHLNYSPLVFYPGWKEEYNDLFSLVKDLNITKKLSIFLVTFNSPKGKVIFF